MKPKVSAKRISILMLICMTLPPGSGNRKSSSRISEGIPWVWILSEFQSRLKDPETGEMGFTENV